MSSSDEDGSVKLVPCIGLTGDNDDITTGLVGKDPVLEATCVDVPGLEEVKDKLRAEDI